MKILLRVLYLTRISSMLRFTRNWFYKARMRRSSCIWYIDYQGNISFDWAIRKNSYIEFRIRYTHPVTVLVYNRLVMGDIYHYTIYYKYIFTDDFDAYIKKVLCINQQIRNNLSEMQRITAAVSCGMSR